MQIDMNCKFQQSRLNPNLYVCEFCKTVVNKDNALAARTCPSLLDRYAKDPNFPQVRLDKIQIEDKEGNIVQTIEGEQAKQWDQNNPHQDKKQCSQEQIDNRLAICQTCEFYQNNSCLKCGCTLNRDKNYMNKLLWADQRCPVDKWGPIE